MLSSRRLLLVGALALAASSGLTGCIGRSCTTEARSALTVTVIDDATGTRVCDATVVTLVDGQTVALMPFGGSDPTTCTYSGAWEQDGSHVVTATKAGYESATSDPVVVPMGECHVEGQVVTLRIRRSGGT